MEENRERREERENRKESQLEMLFQQERREAIDAYYEGRKWHLSPERERELKLMFNRGFTEGHLFRDPLEKRMSHYRPNHQGVRIGTVERYDKKTGFTHTRPIYSN